MSDKPPQDDWLTVKEVASILRYDPQTVWRKIRKREIPGVLRLGRAIRVSRICILQMTDTEK